MLPDPIAMVVVARSVLLVVVRIVRESQSAPVRDDVTEPGPLVSDARVVNGSIVLYTTVAFAEPDTATAATTPEMKVEGTRIAELLERCPARTPTLPCRQ
jgi:hypothetical protein